MTVKELTEILNHAESDTVVEVLVGDDEVGYFGTNDIKAEEIKRTKKSKLTFVITSAVRIVRVPGEMPQ